MNSDTAGRPVLVRGKTQLLFGGMGRLSENCVLNLKNKSHSVTAEIEVPKSGAEGVIVAQGANIGGWSLYAKNGKLKYCYNVAGVKHFFVESADALPAGAHQVRMEFAYAGGGLGKGGKVTLFVDGKPVGEGNIRHDAGDDLLGRRRLRRRRGLRAPRCPRTTARSAMPSTASSRACCSRSRMTRRTRGTWSRRRTPSAPRWGGSSRLSQTGTVEG